MRNPTWAVDGLVELIRAFTPAKTGVNALMNSTHPASRRLIPGLEVSQIGRRLVLAGGHEVAVAAAIVGLLADLDQLLVARAIIFLPDRGRVAPVGLQNRPGTRIGIVDQGDLVVQQRGVLLVEIDALL